MAQGLDDFRVHVGFPRNLKTRRLRAALGAEGVVSLLTLWAYTAEHHPDGELGPLDETSIELAAEWPGERGALVRELLDLVWIERDGDGTVTLHDWAEHQPFLAERAARQERSRIANAAKAAKRKAERRRKAGSKGSQRSTGSVTDPETDTVTDPEAASPEAGHRRGSSLPPSHPPSHHPPHPQEGGRADEQQGGAEGDALGAAIANLCRPSSMSLIARAAQEILAAGVPERVALKLLGQLAPTLRGELPLSIRSAVVRRYRDEGDDDALGPQPCPGCGDPSPPALFDTRRGLRCPRCADRDDDPEEIHA